MKKIKVRYNTFDGSTIKKEDVEGMDWPTYNEYLKQYYNNREEEFDMETNSIDLHQMGVVNLDFSQMKQFPKLKDIILGYNGFIYMDLTPLKECKNLRRLLLDMCRYLMELDLSPLSECKKFELITLRGCQIKEIDLTGISHPSLKWVELPGTLLTRVDLSSLANCSKLEYLALDDNQLKEINLEPLQACKNLETLYLNGNQLENIDLAPLAKCIKLKDLRLEGNLYNTIDLQPLGSLKNLEVVKVDDVEVIEPEGGIPVLSKGGGCAPIPLEELDDDQLDESQ